MPLPRLDRLDYVGRYQIAWSPTALRLLIAVTDDDLHSVTDSLPDSDSVELILGPRPGDRPSRDVVHVLVGAPPPAWLLRDRDPAQAAEHQIVEQVEGFEVHSDRRFAAIPAMGESVTWCAELRVQWPEGTELAVEQLVGLEVAVLEREAEAADRTKVTWSSCARFPIDAEPRWGLAKLVAAPQLSQAPTPCVALGYADCPLLSSPQCVPRADGCERLPYAVSCSNE